MTNWIFTALANGPNRRNTSLTTTWEDVNEIIQSTATPTNNFDVTNKVYVDSLLFTIQGFTTVGVGAQYNYPTMQLAIAAGHQKLYVATNITETVPQTFAGNLTVVFADSITVTFDDASPFTCQAAQAILVLIAEGTGCEWVPDFSAPATIVNMDAVTGSPPSKMQGSFLIQSNVTPGIDVKPVSSRSASPQAFIIDGSIVYVNPNSIGSYFDFDDVAINGVFVIVGGGTPTKAMNVELGGVIQNILLVGSFDIGTPVVTIQSSVIINKITSLVSDASASVYIKDSTVSNVRGKSLGLTVILDSTGSLGSACGLSYGSNINLVLNGILASISKVNILAFDDSAVTSGMFNFEDVIFATTPIFSATDGATNYNFEACSCVDGFNSMLSFSKWVNCTAGDLASPGGTSTFTIPITADSVQIYNCIADDILVDNGTNSSFSYKLF